MLIFPAIDLIDGKAVRLFQGDYDQCRFFDGTPAEHAIRFAAAARQLHVVDLDGARLGSPQNIEAIGQIRAAVPDVLIELGGGIRTGADVGRWLEAGIDRVILGTSALEQDFLHRMIKRYGTAVSVGVDARGGRVAVGGWLETTDRDSLEFCRSLRDMGVEHIIYTDIARDGAGRGANLEIYARLAQIDGLRVTASGGVGTLEDIAALRDMGLYAAIVGRALYTGQLDLVRATEAARTQ